MDKIGADFQNCVNMIAERTGARPCPVQIPIGSENELEGLVDLITMKEWTWRGEDLGATWTCQDVRDELKEKAEQMRGQMVEMAVEMDDDAMEAYLEGKEPTEGDLKKCIRKGTINFVNNVPIDTIPTDIEKFFQVKIYDKGKVMFLSRDLTVEDSSLQGFYGGGIYGNFTFENGVLSEIIDYGTFGNEQFHKNWPTKNEKGESVLSFEVDLKQNTYSQAWPTAQVYQDLGFGATAEYYERLK